MSGRQHYEWMHSNMMGVVPDRSTIEEKINSYSGRTVLEGEIDTTALVDYIGRNRLPPIVLVAEDATAIQQRREYDPKSNSITGICHLNLMFCQIHQ